MPRFYRLIAIITLITSPLFLLQNCGDIQKIRSYLNITHTIEAVVAVIDSTDSENGTIGFVLKLSENGSVTNKLRLEETENFCSFYDTDGTPICNPATSLAEPYIAQTIDQTTHFMYNTYSDNSYNTNIYNNGDNVSRVNYTNQPYLNVSYGALKNTENNEAMLYNAGVPQVLESGKGASGSLTTTGIYPWAITSLDLDNFHNNKRIQLKARLFSNTSWTLAYTALVGSVGPVHPYNDRAVHFAYKSTDNNTCNYVRVGITSAGTGFETLVGPLSVQIGTTGIRVIADNGITSCDLTMSKDGKIIVLLRGCQNAAGSSDESTCSADRNVTVVQESTLSTDETLFSSPLHIISINDDIGNIRFGRIYRDIARNVWVYAYEQTDNVSANILGDFLKTRAGSSDIEANLYEFTEAGSPTGVELFLIFFQKILIVS